MEPDDKTSGMTDRVKDFHKTIAETCIPRIDRATVPIIAVQNDKILHDRSAVLYKVGGQHFALTAAHFLRDMVQQNIGLYISVNRPDVMPIPLADALFHSTEVEERDLAAIWIPPDVASEVAKYKDFLLHNQINFTQDRSNALLLFYGYPEQWSGHLITETGIVSKALAFSSFEDFLDPDEVQQYDPKLHILMNFTADAIEATTGRVDRLPHLGGISGCGIWQVGDKMGKSAVPRDEHSLTLVAIQHGWYKSLNRVKATRIEYLLGLLLDNYPDLKSAMSLAYPSR